MSHGADELRRRVAAGERAAVSQVIEQLSPGLRRMFAQRLAGRWDRVDDLVQRTWGNFWESLRRGRYDPQRAAVSTFVYAIANNVYLQERRSSSAGGLGSADLLADVAISGPAGSPDHALDYAALLDAVRGAIERRTGADCLSELERAMVLGTAAGESERSVAAALGLAPSSAHLHKVNAYKKLRSALAAEGFSAETVEQLLESAE